MGKESELSVLHRIDSRGAFLKVRQVLRELGKMQCSFVSYDKDSHKLTAAIDVYMDAEEYGLFLMRPVGRGELREKAEYEKRSADKEGRYPKAVWTSPMGGKKTEGGAISRFFTISPGLKSEIVLTAYEYHAHVSPTGAYVTDKGSRPSKTVRVPARFADLEMMAYKSMLAT